MEHKHEPSEFKAAVQAKCPRCRTGNIFTNKLFSLHSQKMNDNCPHCSLRFEREPGYFYVAMYVSYVFIVAELVAFCVLTYLITGYMDSPWPYIIVATATGLLFAPFNFRYSRIVLLYWLTSGLRYDPKFKDLDGNRL